MEHVASLELPSPPEASNPAEDELEALLERAWANDPQNTDQLNATIGKLPAYGPSGRALLGQRLLSLLESRRLALMVGTDGSCAETHAAARVLELGFPWALHLTPELLVRVRALPKRTRPRPRGLAFAVSAVATGFALVDVLVAATAMTRVGPLSSLFAWTAGAALVANLFFATGLLERKKLALGSGIMLFAGWMMLGMSSWGSEGMLLGTLLAPYFFSMLSALSPGAEQERQLE